jgi:DNA-binding MarR family transcriptional regulator
VLLSFSRVGALPLSTIGERLQVHPTSVTNAIDRLESAGLVTRTPDDTDRRRTLAVLTDQGRATLAKATGAVTAQQFFLDGLTDDDADALYRMLRGLRFSCCRRALRPPRTSTTLRRLLAPDISVTSRR